MSVTPSNPSFKTKKNLSNDSHTLQSNSAMTIPSPTKKKTDPLTGAERERAKARSGSGMLHLSSSASVSSPSSRYDSHLPRNPSSSRPPATLRRTHSSRERADVRPPFRSNNSSHSVHTISPTRSRTVTHNRSSNTFLRSRPSKDDLEYMSPSSDSSDSLEDVQLPPQPSTSQSTSRKVAASLDLFKVNVPPPATQPDGFPHPETLLQQDSHTDPDTQGHEEVSGAQFVKRAEWPDRETAASRRDKSTAAQDRARTRERKAEPGQSAEPTEFRRLPQDLGSISRTPSQARISQTHGELTSRPKKSPAIVSSHRNFPTPTPGPAPTCSVSVASPPRAT
jgi:hypothetical protein